jgi:hypothetical protein
VKPLVNIFFVFLCLGGENVVSKIVLDPPLEDKEFTTQTRIHRPPARSACSSERGEKLAIVY